MLLCVCRYPLIATEEVLPTLWEWLEKEEEFDRSKYNEICACTVRSLFVSLACCYSLLYELYDIIILYYVIHYCCKSKFKILQ